MKKTFYLFFILFSQIIQSQVSDFKNIDFTKADNIAKLNHGENLINLPLLCYKLTHKLNSDVEKFRAIYSWVSNNVKVDYPIYKKVIQNRKKLIKDSISLNLWNKIYKEKVFKTLINKKRTICTGYAYLIKEMANIVDIECRIIDGYGRTVTSNMNSLKIPNHSWNAVNLDGKWYLCDATWSSGYIDEKRQFIQDYNDGYFLTHPDLFNKNHYPLKKKWQLSSKLTENSFVEAPIVYGEIFKYKISPLTPVVMKINTNKNIPITFKYKLLNNHFSEKISLICIYNQKEKKLNIYDFKNKDDFISFKYCPTKGGNYDVHLKINNDIVASYIINIDNEKS
ncbi:transglutaminase domain-containing protein [uncultured Tenacibaculum sp.]|uniref:transglutaminase domain-containing protein n=1 Tax=uncultured Tenacibaculum sp. TaxID=174713 RepID=UPI00260DCCEB|nr:transglutaminase domain-containing protein [uncultured Tenacibaculum sp.]